MMRQSPTRNRRTRPTTRARQQFILDVNVRNKTAKRIRSKRISSWAGKFTFWTLLIIGSAVLVQTLFEKCFLQNSAYNLKKIEAQLADILTEEEALRIARIEKEQNIFKIDLSQAECELEKLPDIITARVSRKLPETLLIELTTRKPVAWVADPSPSNSTPPPQLLTDSSGFIYKPHRILPEYYHLPIIYGIDRNLLALKNPLEEDELKKAIELLNTRDLMTESTLQIQSIDISKGYCIEVTDAKYARILFDTTDFKEQLQRLQKLLDYCQETGRELETVNLIPKRNTPVRFHQLAAPKLGKRNDFLDTIHRIKKIITTQAFATPLSKHPSHSKITPNTETNEVVPDKKKFC